MVKVVAPIHSVSASGVLVDFLTFSNRKKYNLCRWQKKQKDSNTIKQNVQRSQFLLARDIASARDFGNTIFGFSLFGLDPSGLKTKSSHLNISWYNYLIQQIIKWQ